MLPAFLASLCRLALLRTPSRGVAASRRMSDPASSASSMSSLPAQSSTSSPADATQPNSSGGPAPLDRSFVSFTSSANPSSSVKSKSSTVYLASQPDPSSHAQLVHPVGTPPGSDTLVSPGSDNSEGVSSRSASSRPPSSGEQAYTSGHSDHVSSDKKGQHSGTHRNAASHHACRLVRPC